MKIVERHLFKLVYNVNLYFSIVLSKTGRRAFAVRCAPKPKNLQSAISITTSNRPAVILYRTTIAFIKMQTIKLCRRPTVSSMTTAPPITSSHKSNNRRATIHIIPDSSQAEEEEEALGLFPSVTQRRAITVIHCKNAGCDNCDDRPTGSGCMRASVRYGGYAIIESKQKL